MSERRYKNAFLTALAACLALAGALAYVTSETAHHAPEQNSIVVARGPDVPERSATPGTPSPVTSTPQLTPVQLSPQRLQAIGVPIPPNLLLILPYILAFVIVVSLKRKSGAPAALGVPYEKESTME